jgi:hypothetical protein
MLASFTTEALTAWGTIGAAVGTVGAVIIALYQTTRRDRYKVHVKCMIGATRDEQLVSLQATNTGERLVKLTMAYLATDDGSQVYAPFYTPPSPSGWIANFPTDPLPVSLVDGESVNVRWKLSALEAAKAERGFSDYLYAFFTDPLGNIYSAPYPGVKVKRKGLLWRRREYVPPRDA